MTDDTRNFNKQNGADRVRTLLGGKDTPKIDAAFDAIEAGTGICDTQEADLPTGDQPIS